VLADEPSCLAEKAFCLAQCLLVLSLCFSQQSNKHYEISIFIIYYIITIELLRIPGVERQMIRTVYGKPISSAMYWKKFEPPMLIIKKKSKPSKNQSMYSE
jgi:hypothetical protein